MSLTFTATRQQPAGANAEAQYWQACWRYLDRLFCLYRSDRELRELAAEIEALCPRVRS